MSNQKTSQLRRVSGSQLIYGDLIPLVDVSENTSPTGETKAISVGDLSSYIVSGGFLEVFTPMHDYQSANGLVFDQFVAPETDLNLRCYGEFPEIGTEFSLMVRAFIPSSMYEDIPVFRAIFGIGESPSSLTSGSQVACIGMEGDNLIGHTYDGIDTKRIEVNDFTYDYEDKVFESVLTRDSSGTLKLYLNSTLIGTMTGSATIISSSYVVMGNGHPTAFNIDCTIYEAHVFNTELTANNVKSMFYGGVKNSDTTLVASYTSPNLNPGPTQWLDSKGTNHILLPVTGARASNPDKEFSLRLKSDGTSGFLGNGNKRDILPDNYVLTDAFVYSTGSPLLSIGSTSSVAPVGASGIRSWNNNRVPLTNAIYSRNNLQLLELGVAHTDKSIYVFYSSSAAPCTFSFEGYISDYGPLTYSPPAPVITSSLYETATNGISYIYQILATNYPVIYSSSNLPTGLYFNNLTGLISGIPSDTATIYYVELFAANYDATGSAIMTMSLAPATTPTPTPTPSGTGPTPTPTPTPTATPTPTPTSTSVVTSNTKAIFGYGSTSTTTLSITNKVDNNGTVATDTTGVGTVRYGLAAAGYGGDKAIFGYGAYGGIGTAITNLVSNAGVVATDTTGVGTARMFLAAAGYGLDKALFGYGTPDGGYTTAISTTNLVSNTGVVSTDTTGVGTARGQLAAAGYGNDKAIFGYGYTTTGTYVSMTNLVGNTGVVATDTTGVGTGRSQLAAAGYGNDKAIFGYGNTVSMTNLVSNTGVVASDTTGVGTARFWLAAAGYGGDKAIFGYGYNSVTYVSMTNLVSNNGVVASDTTGVGTARWVLAAAGYSLS